MRTLIQPSKRPVSRNKRAYDFVLPLDRFDQATLAEARKVLTGESEWFVFDEQGDLKVRNAETTPKGKILNAQHRAQLLAAIENPGSVREKIAALEAWDPYAVDTPYMQKLAESYCGDEQLGLIRNERSRQREYEVSSLEGLLETAAMYPQREAHLAAFETMVQANKMPGATHASHKRDVLDLYVLEAQLRQLSDVVPEAEKEAFAPRLAAARQAFSERVVAEDSPSKFDKFLQMGKKPERPNFDEDRLTMLQAVASLLARSIPAETFVQARDQFNEQVTVTVRAQTSPFMQALDKAKAEGKRARMEKFADEDEASHNRSDVPRDLEALQNYAEQLHKLRRGEVPMPVEEQFMGLGHDERAARAWYNPTQVMGQMLRYTENIDRSHPDIWRLHNSYPEAVNFIVANRHAKFLLGHNGEQGDIPDAAAFLGSEFLHHAGQVGMHVNPQLLAVARLQSKGHGRTNDN